MKESFSNRDWLTLVFFCVAAPFVHFYVQLYWSMFALRFFPGTRSQLATMLWLYTQDLAGVILAALLLAAPLAWLVRRRPFLLAAFLALSTTAVALLLWQGSFTNNAAYLTFAELASFFLVCWLIATIVIRRVGLRAYAT
jgi:hypothetical protein